MLFIFIFILASYRCMYPAFHNRQLRNLMIQQSPVVRCSRKWQKYNFNKMFRFRQQSRPNARLPPAKSVPHPSSGLSQSIPHSTGQCQRWNITYVTMAEQECAGFVSVVFPLSNWRCHKSKTNVALFHFHYDAEFCLHNYQTFPLFLLNSSMESEKLGFFQPKKRTSFSRRWSRKRMRPLRSTMTFLILIRWPPSSTASIRTHSRGTCASTSHIIR